MTDTSHLDGISLQANAEFTNPKVLCPCLETPVMKVRGQRECKDCGARWSYYETGSVECPDCGSLRSVGVESERRLHTDGQAEFDLTEAREVAETGTLREAADCAAEVAREYVRRRGFVRGGDLLALDDTYLAAAELRHAADVVGRGLQLDDDEELYFLALLQDADAGRETADEIRDDANPRPDPSEVPESMHAIRGLADADAVGEYRREMADWVEENGAESDGRDALGTLREHVKRVQALDGDVAPETAEVLVVAAREVGLFLRDGDAEALASACERFDRLSS
jgi:DNA-directed RNA polymerase subunit RPC12/RpoP